VPSNVLAPPETHTPILTQVLVQNAVFHDHG
jgi:hypothetical protein